MKVKYQFVNEMVEIEVDNDWSAVITELDRKERNNNKTETRRHCSFDAFDMETSFYGVSQKSRVQKRICYA